MEGFRLASEACVAGEIAFASTLDKFDGDLRALASDDAHQFYVSSIGAKGGLSAVFGPVWMMSYEYAVQEGRSIVSGFVDPYQQSHPGLAASGQRAATNIAGDRYKEFCVFLAGKLIASGKARRDLEQLARRNE